MGSDRVVLVQPLPCDDLGFRDRLESPAIQTGRPEYAVEAFVVGVLPRTAGIDVMGVDSVTLQPGFDLLSDELRTIVAA